MKNLFNNNLKSTFLSKNILFLKYFTIVFIILANHSLQDTVFQIYGRVPWNIYQIPVLTNQSILFLSLDWNTTIQQNTSYSAKIMNPQNVQETRTPLGRPPLILNYDLSSKIGNWQIILQTSNMNPYIPFTLTYNLNNDLSTQKKIKSNPFFYTSVNGDFYNFEMPSTDFIMTIDMKNQKNLAMAVGYGKNSISDSTQRNIQAVTYGDQVTYNSGENFGKGTWQVFISSTSGSLQPQYFQATIDAVRNCSGQTYSTGQLSQSSDLQCKCIDEYTWSVENQNCQRDCSMVPYAIKANGQNCICEKSFVFNKATNKCQIVCLGIMNAKGNSLDLTTCQCQQNFDWIFQKRSCYRNCQNDLFSTNKSLGNSCQCLSEFKWNWVNQYCQKDCSLQANSNGKIVLGSQNYCQCNPSYTWNTQRQNCQRQGYAGPNNNYSQSATNQSTQSASIINQWYVIVLLISGAVIVIGGIIILVVKVLISKLFNDKSVLPQQSDRQKNENPRLDTQMNALQNQNGPTLTQGDQQQRVEASSGIGIIKNKSGSLSNFDSRMIRNNLRAHIQDRIQK